MRAVYVIKGFFGYVWAIGVIFVAAMGFVNMDYFSQKLIIDNGVHVTENWTGGEVTERIDHGDYVTSVHQPVLRGVDLFNRKGYIQVDWSSENKLPAVINEEVDLDSDGDRDFAITVDTVKNRAELKAYSDKVLSLTEEDILVYSKSRTVRVLFKK